MADDIFVAMPVYRGVEYVKEAVRSLREQTYPHFRALISVDGVDDPTADLCKEFTKDSRFEVVVQPERLGWPGNFNWLASRRDRPFFCYWQQDDFTSANYLEDLRNAMVLDDRVAIAHTDVQWVGARFRRDSASDLDGLPLACVMEMVERIHYQPLRGVIRSDMMPTRRDVIPADVGGSHSEFVFLAELAAKGSFRCSTGSLYFKRLHADSYHVRSGEATTADKMRDWISMGGGFLRVATPLTPPADRGRLLATLLDRLFITRPGRVFHVLCDQAEASVAKAVHDFLHMTGIDLSDSTWPMREPCGLDRPVHPFVVNALAAELEQRSAIRAVLQDQALESGHRLLLGIGQPAQALLGTGWSYPETWGVWTDGTSAIVDVPAGPHSSIEFVGHVFAPNSALSIDVEVDDDPREQVVSADGEELRVALDVSPRTSHRIHFTMPDARSPRDVEFSDDARVLGVGLREIILRSGNELDRQ